MHSLALTLRRFAHQHDEMPAFHAGYLVITFLVAALFNVGAFALLIGAHMSLDYVKYSEVHGFGMKKTVQGMFFESLVDIMLFAVGLLFTVYFHHATGIIAVSGLLRASESIVAAVGTLIPKLEILHHVYVDFFHVKRHMARIPEELSSGLTVADMICLLLTIVAGILIVIAPSILTLDGSTFLNILSDALIPWNF